MELTKLQHEFIEELLECINGDWQRIELNFEYYPWKDDMMKTYTSEYFYENVCESFLLNLDTVKALAAVNEDMGKNGKEKWTSCLFTLNDTGKYNFEFGYGMPPMTKASLEAAGEI